MYTKKQTNSILCSQNTTQNDLRITNNDDMHSYETTIKNYSIPTTSNTNHHAQRIDESLVSLLNLNTTTKLPTVGKEYMCFQNDGKTAHSAKCIRYRIMTKVIDSILLIDTFEQQYVVLKGMLQSLRIKDHVKNIGIDQRLINNALFEHKCLKNIKKLYKHAGKCDN